MTVNEWENSEFKDAVELFDPSGDNIIPWSEVANFARAFGYNPLDSHVRILLGGGDEDHPASKDRILSFFFNLLLKKII